MKLTLEKGSFAVKNWREVYHDGLKLGSIRIERRSGWRGGPSYRFYLSDDGARLGFQSAAAKTVKELLRKIILEE